MTGFGRGSIDNDERGYVIEIRSVNHRYLDLNLKMPRNIISLEDRVRKYLQQYLTRGKVDVFITQNIFKQEGAKAYLNTDLADSYFETLESIKKRYKVIDDISVSTLARMPDVIYTNHNEEDLEEIWNLISIGLKQAVDNLIAMRQKEGNKLLETILEKCDIISSSLGKIKERAPLVTEEYGHKLREKVKELSLNVPIDENRISLEISLYADKSSIDEEIVRLNSHILQLKDTLKQKESIGRKLDFIVQEMNRETNTIGSKAGDLALVNLVLVIKNEIEKIREQIQNIE
jgi:uncharacterized protein (TIGR00255 family)